jgi:hypothetical protein
VSSEVDVVQKTKQWLEEEQEEENQSDDDMVIRKLYH